MKASQFSSEQIIRILEQAERGEQTISVICREHHIAETTFYRWRKQFGGMTVAEAQRLKELEAEVERDEEARAPDERDAVMRKRSGGVGRGGRRSVVS